MATARATPLSRRLAERLAARDAAGLLRRPGVPGARVLCSNDYLGLSMHRDVREAAARAARDDGAGAGASRLVSGTTPRHRAVEERLASWMGVERCVLFQSGYQANVGLLGALLEPGDFVVSDALNHASLIDGIRLARATRKVVPHADVAAVERALAGAPVGGLRFVVTEAIYSMDGDRAPLAALVDVCDRHDAALIVDEAHALGVVGPGGRGLCAELGLEQRVATRVGTCGKSLGASGAFVAGSHALGLWLENRARSYVYSTAVPPPTLGAIEAAVRLAEAGTLQQALSARVEEFRQALTEAGWWQGVAESAIFPLHVGDPSACVALSEALAGRGYFVQAIRPPTVPDGTSRLRVTVSATYESGLAEAFAAALTEEAARLGLPPRAPE